MRIIGGKDYYDHGLAYGQDDSIVFVRTGRSMFAYPEEARWPNGGTAPGIVVHNAPKPKYVSWGHKEYRLTKWVHDGVTYVYDGVAVIFCGKFYGGARVRWRQNIGGHEQTLSDYDEHKWERETFWDRNSLGKFLGARGASVRAVEKEKQRRKYRAQHKQEMDDTRSRAFARFKLDDAETAFLVREGIAVATHTPDDEEDVKRPGRTHSQKEIFWNVNADTLKLLDFIKVVDPVQAFQELSMWVGGVLPRQGNPMVQITDDKVKLAKHGMDPKWSFRKQPEKVK